MLAVNAPAMQCNWVGRDRLPDVGGVVPVLAGGGDPAVVATLDDVLDVFVTDDGAAEESVSAACVPEFGDEVEVSSVEEVGDSVDAVEDDTAVSVELAVDTLGALADSGPTSANPPIVVAHADTTTTDRHRAADRKNRLIRSAYLRRKRWPHDRSREGVP